MRKVGYLKEIKYFVTFAAEARSFANPVYFHQNSNSEMLQSPVGLENSTIQNKDVNNVSNETKGQAEEAVAQINQSRHLNTGKF